MLLKDLIAPIATAAALAVPASGYAQVMEWTPSAIGRYERQAPYYNAGRTAYDAGYREGRQEGERDARRGDRFAYRDERAFQRADRGYNRSYGDRERYRRTFRDGYAAGYSEGYDRYARSGRDNGRYDNGRGPYAQRGPYGGYGDDRYPGSGYYSPAFDNGTRDGYEKGQEDARKRRSFDVLRHGWYRDGDRHYEGRYGSRQEYKNVYRQGFQQGYEQGFREGRYRY